MSGRLVVHAHFYQPDRRDPASGTYPPEPSARPARDWNTRIADECYVPNAKAGNFGRISYDLGPTLARWLAAARPDAHQLIRRQGRGAMAQGFHHTILPLATQQERRLEIAWGLRDAQNRWGRRPAGIWLPETACDRATLADCAELGVRYVLLAPWQAGSGIDTRRPYRVDLPGGRSIVVMLYDGGVSGRLSFDASLSTDADRFAAQELAPRLGGRVDGGGEPLLVIATDGELYGHHQPFRVDFLARLTTHGAGYGITDLETALGSLDPRSLPRIELAQGASSWSCHHGVLRWSGECPCTGHSGWKAPLRAALRAHATRVDEVAGNLANRGGWMLGKALPGYGDVLSGFMKPLAYASQVSRRDPLRTATILAAVASRYAMFSSCAWFWDEPTRPEPLAALRHARYAAKVLDGFTGGHPLEDALVRDLGRVVSPATGVAGSGLLARAA